MRRMRHNGARWWRRHDGVEKD
jgi:hypothetical protein